MTSPKEQFYIQRIAELESQLKQRDERIAELLKINEASLRTNAGPYRKRPADRAASYRCYCLYERWLSLFVFDHS